MRAKGTKRPAMGGTVLPWKNCLEQNVPPWITAFKITSHGLTEEHRAIVGCS